MYIHNIYVHVNACTCILRAAINELNRISSHRATFMCCVYSQAKRAVNMRSKLQKVRVKYRNPVRSVMLSSVSGI